MKARAVHDWVFRWSTGFSLNSLHAKAWTPTSIPEHAIVNCSKVEWHEGELFPRVGFIVTNSNQRAKNVIKFYNGRGTAEQWIKEGKNAIQWTKLSCRTFKDNQTRLQLFALAYNLANFLRRLALPRSVQHWSLTTLREKLVKIGAKVTRHSKYVTFQLAEVAVPRNLFAAILRPYREVGNPAAIGCLRTCVASQKSRRLDQLWMRVRPQGASTGSGLPCMVVWRKENDRNCSSWPRNQHGRWELGEEMLQ